MKIGSDYNNIREIAKLKMRIATVTVILQVTDSLLPFSFTCSFFPLLLCMLVIVLVVIQMAKFKLTQASM